MSLNILNALRDLLLRGEQVSSPAQRQATSTAQIDEWRAAKSETEHLEFKEANNGYSFDNLLKYCAALSNEGGGHLLLGVANKPPRPVVGTNAFPDIIKTKTDIFYQLHFRVEIDEVRHSGKRVLVFIIPSRPIGQPRELKGQYWMRIGESLVPMTTDQIKKIFNETKSNSAPLIAGAAIILLLVILIAWFRYPIQKPRLPSSGPPSVAKQPESTPNTGNTGNAKSLAQPSSPAKPVLPSSWRTEIPGWSASRVTESIDRMVGMFDERTMDWQMAYTPIDAEFLTLSGDTPEKIAAKQKAKEQKRKTLDAERRKGLQSLVTQACELRTAVLTYHLLRPTEITADQTAYALCGRLTSGNFSVQDVLDIRAYLVALRDRLNHPR